MSNYAIWFHKDKDDTEGGLLKLDSSGIVEQTRNAFEAKIMPSKEHAAQLAHSVLKGVAYAEVMQVYDELVSCGSVIVDGKNYDFERKRR